MATRSMTSSSNEALGETVACGGVASNDAVPIIVRANKNSHRELGTFDSQRFVVDREIARGGMGRIMAAHDCRLGRPVAIKELLIDSSELHARFEREARITARLQHPAIVNLLDAGEWPGGEPFYVMKLVTGESLDTAIAQRPTLEERLALLPNVIAAVDALAYAHSMRVIRPTPPHGGTSLSLAEASATLSSRKATRRARSRSMRCRYRVPRRSQRATL
jgi:hypothetical protein